MTARILVADDSTLWSGPFCDFLARWGYQADSVATGEELMDRIQQRPDDYDILIIDNSMPEKEGGPELPYCGVCILGRLVSHFNEQERYPEVLRHVIVRSIYSRQDLDNLRNEADVETEMGCTQVATWLDRNAPLAQLMEAIVNQLSGPARGARGRL